MGNDSIRSRVLRLAQQQELLLQSLDDLKSNLVPIGRDGRRWLRTRGHMMHTVTSLTKLAALFDEFPYDSPARVKRGPHSFLKS